MGKTLHLDNTKNYEMSSFNQITSDRSNDTSARSDNTIQTSNDVNNRSRRTSAGSNETSKTNRTSDINSGICERCTDDFNGGNNDNLTSQENSLTQVQKFYNGKNILITGATGFLGKILMEKLLRCCPGVENLYLLVRQKRGKDIYTRIEEIFDDPVFERLKSEVPKFRHKLVVVPADCDAAGLGLTLTDRQMLIEKVNIIFHSAATVKFDEHLKTALTTNVRAPLHLLRLAQDMRGLDVLMHISTAYSNSNLQLIEERFYPFEGGCDKLERVLDKLGNDEVYSMLPSILGDWPNTYTYTKAMAEKELRAAAGTVPLGIFRPAIVISTAKEPLEGWLDNMYGPTGITVGAATGILRTMQCDASVTADIVPVDGVVNCLMVAAADVHNTYKHRPPPAEPPIFNYVSSTESPVTWGEFMDLNVQMLHKYPATNAVWFLTLRITRSVALQTIYMFLLHIVPAMLIDTLAVCAGKKPKMMKVYKRVQKFSQLVAYFCTKELIFRNDRTQDLWQRTSEADKKLFPFSMASFDWPEYFEAYILGIRRYLFKESDDTLPQARIKWKRLYYLHQLVKIIFCILAFYVLWYIFSAFL